jgi:hypothetical protein
MNFDQLWDCVKGKNVKIFTKYVNGVESKALTPESINLKVDTTLNVKYIEFYKLHGDTGIPGIPGNIQTFLPVYENQIGEVVKEKDSILIKNEFGEYKITF